MNIIELKTLGQAAVTVKGESRILKPQKLSFLVFFALEQIKGSLELAKVYAVFWPIEDRQKYDEAEALFNRLLQTDSKYRNVEEKELLRKASKGLNAILNDLHLMVPQLFKVDGVQVQINPQWFLLTDLQRLAKLCQEGNVSKIKALTETAQGKLLVFMPELGIPKESLDTWRSGVRQKLINIVWQGYLIASEKQNSPDLLEYVFALTKSLPDDDSSALIEYHFLAQNGTGTSIELSSIQLRLCFLLSHFGLQNSILAREIVAELLVGADVKGFWQQVRVDSAEELSRPFIPSRDAFELNNVTWRKINSFEGENALSDDENLTAEQQSEKRVSEAKSDIYRTTIENSVGISIGPNSKQKIHNYPEEQDI